MTELVREPYSDFVYRSGLESLLACCVAFKKGRAYDEGYYSGSRVISHGLRWGFGFLYSQVANRCALFGLNPGRQEASRQTPQCL